MKEYYISLMSKALSAYTDEHIQSYFATVKNEGLTEHGFPRLTANIGILISHGIRTDLLPLFCEMMELCCKNIPCVKAANDFSVKEIIFCIMALEEKNVLDAEVLARWKAYLAEIDPVTCYSKFARTPTDKVFNWALFTTVSEYMRQYIGLCDSSDFVDIQIASQLQWLDENGMYQDAFVHPPMVYDLVSRGLFALLLHFGYKGRYYEEIDACLKKAGLLTLKMQSVTGEIPYGGRSNQFLYIEALLAIVCEYEANRYAKEGDMALAAKFKTAVKRALQNTEHWLSKKPIRHIKNRFPTETKYGCERYAYFDKYMITTASYLYAAYLLCDDAIPTAEDQDNAPCIFRTSEHFHKLFMRCGGYALEFDTNAHPIHDASGLGRVHKEGAPSAICLSLPCPATPKYVVDIEDPIALSLCPGILQSGGWQFATGPETKYEIVNLSQNDRSAVADIRCCFPTGADVQTRYTVNADGVQIEVHGNGDIAFMLPAFCFDGEDYPEITYSETCLSVSYMGWICRYTTDGIIMDSGEPACNRNGHYRAFLATSQNALRVKIEVLKME